MRPLDCGAEAELFHLHRLGERGLVHRAVHAGRLPKVALHDVAEHGVALGILLLEEGTLVEVLLQELALVPLWLLLLLGQPRLILACLLLLTQPTPSLQLSLLLLHLLPPVALGLDALQLAQLPRLVLAHVVLVVCVVRHVNLLRRHVASILTARALDDKFERVLAPRGELFDAPALRLLLCFLGHLLREHRLALRLGHEDRLEQHPPAAGARALVALSL
mmetsp:Transcript_5958/g.15599  ORF Transcript_5958/g.15599 Transcript_5958/m.15599 type:complete len:220 (-) Transcript_5958:147-806(-)